MLKELTNENFNDEIKTGLKFVEFLLPGAVTAKNRKMSLNKWIKSG